MHTNTATNCRSRYTIDDALVLTCNIPLERHHTSLSGDMMHKGSAYDAEWYWKDREADK